MFKGKHYPLSGALTIGDVALGDDVNKVETVVAAIVMGYIVVFIHSL